LKLPKYVWRSTDPRKTKWDLFVMVLATWNCFTIPLAVSFKPPAMESGGIVAINALIDICFFIDILVTSRTTIINNKTEEEIVQPKEIFKNYAQSRLWIDICSTVPFDLLILWMTGKQNKYF